MVIEETTSLLNFYSILQQYRLYQNISFNNFKKLMMQDDFSNGLFFRGQSKKYNSINCLLSRDDGFKKNESLMYSETLKVKWSDFDKYSKPIEYLSKMQHYGIPTRLIDFTVNPFVALFFAVQDDNNTDDASVYVYQDSGININDIECKILSILPTINKKSTLNIQKEINNILEISLSESDIKKILNKAYFINYSSLLTDDNIRLKNQSGTFAICGTKVINSKITNIPCDVDIKKCYLKITIPYQYKQEIKHQLNSYLQINDNYIYPELTEWSKYIKDKYCKKSFNINKSFSVVSIKDISLPEIKRAEIKIVLNKKLNIQEIKSCVTLALKKSCYKYHVIWFFVATNGENYTLNNWILKGQWIAANIPEQYSQVPFSEIDDNRYFWDDKLKFNDREQYNLNTIFKDNKYLFILFHHCYRMLYPIFQDLEYAYEIQDYEDFREEVKKRKHQINTICEKSQSFGRPKDYNFDNYIWSYYDFFISLSDITYWINLKDCPTNFIDYRINKCFNNIRSSIKQIELDKKKWMKEFKISNHDLIEQNYDISTIQAIKFRQYIPISENALNVTISLSYSLDEYGLHINGNTNLFDGANILLTFSLQYGFIISQMSAEVINNEFEYIIGLDNLKYDNYSVLLTLMYPRKQPLLFIDKAGEEYENLNGEYINHSGIDSTLEYQEYFNINSIKC